MEFQNDLRFQIVDILSDDWTMDKHETYLNSKNEEKTKLTNYKEFIITLYGINELNQRIVCHVYDYKPYMFLKIPNEWDMVNVKKLLKNISNEQLHCLKQIVTCKDFYGLHLNLNTDIETKTIQEFQFLKLSFKSHKNMKQFISKSKKYYNSSKDTINENEEKHPSQGDLILQQWKKTPTTINCDSNLYESNIHPVIKFIHDSRIDPTGWISMNNSDKSDYKTKLFTTCSYEYTCPWKNIEPIQNDQLSSYKIASFDIECDSSHGDFPMAIKNYKKFSSDIFDTYQKILKNVGPIYNKKIESQLFNIFRAGFENEPSYLGVNQKYSDITPLVLNMKPSEETIENIIFKILNDEPNESRNHIQVDITNLDVKSKDRNNSISEIENILSEELSDANIIHMGDPIIQIGTVFYEYGTGQIFRHILVIAPEDNLEEKEICDDLDGITVEKCSSEKKLLIQWQQIIKNQDPDFITGYNIFGFDFRYIHDRAKVLFPCPVSGKKTRCKHPYYHVKGCPYKEFMNFGKMNSVPYKAKDHYCKTCKSVQQELSSSALGENKLFYIMMDGRILFDIQKEVQKSHNLESYKLDNVASHFMRGKLKQVSNNEIIVSDTGHLKNGDYISFRTHTNIGEELFEDGKKYQIDTLKDKKIQLTETLPMNLQEYHKVEWCLNKDDISPQDIFDKHKYGGPSGRAEVAKYCIQDCELCINLLLLLDIIPNNLGMANVSYVPASFIFLRGQGVKVTSVVSRMCAQRNTKIPELKKIPRLNDYIKMLKNGSSDNDITDKMKEDEGYHRHPWEREEWLKRVKIQSAKGIEGYEGAIVLQPKPGIYLDDPISVLDYASLYPSSIIEKNISHETYIENKELLPLIGKENYYTIEFQDWIYRNKGKGDTIEKVPNIDGNGDETYTTCHFLKPEYMIEKKMFQKDEKPMGIIPAVLDHLLSARKKTKSLMKNETDEFKKKVLDGLQLAYKVTANSVYGQLGAKTSTIFKMNLAACTTSVGREKIDAASAGVKTWANKKGYKEPEIIYGDTDSVFVKFNRELNGTLLTGKEALKHCIQCGQEAGEYITKGILHKEIDGEIQIKSEKPLLNQPQILEYEKTFWPFILISKKRYTGDKYEFNHNECKRDAMGIVLKRRDNAPIVKHVFGNVIEKIMIDKDFDLAVNWLTETLQMIQNQEFSLRYFIITKALRGYYKNPQQIAHKVLADRMAERDPGNKPKANDRIPYAYIQIPDNLLYDYENPYKSGTRKGQPRVRNIMQGDRIEHVDYIQQHDIPIDYKFYISNQIMNPVKQVLDLRMDPKETEKLFSIL